MNSPLNKLYFILSLAFIGFLLVYLPGQWQKQTSQAQKDKFEKTWAIDSQAIAKLSWEQALKPAPQKNAKDSKKDFQPTNVVRIKKSGQETKKEELSPEVQAYLNVRDAFEGRFGHSYERAWEDQEPVTHDFPMPESIEDMVEYWVYIFGIYDKTNYLIYFEDDITRVYAAYDFKSWASMPGGKTAIKNMLAQEKKRLRKLVLNIQKKQKSQAKLTKKEQRLVDLFSEENGGPGFEKAADLKSMRVYRGFAHRFKKAIAISGRYMEEMENIFSMMGLPIELTRLPLIESAFNIRAISSAKAAGMWQFIPATGKRYLKINKYADERIDPILATYAAATHLKHEYELLGEWSLTVNAYNTGPGRMLQAIKQLGTKDIGVIINNFKGRGYRFYSKNYYPEFLAAVHVYENQEKYFGKIVKQPPLKYDLYHTQFPIDLHAVSKKTRTSIRKLKELNPAFRAQYFSKGKLIPSDYFIRLPKDHLDEFAIAANNHFEQRSNAQWHIVKKGDTIESIANYYAINESVLEEALKKKTGGSLNVGQTLALPRDQQVAFEKKQNKKSKRK